LSPTLNTLVPEAVAHGSEILLQAQGPAGGYITIAEIYQLQYDADNKVEPMNILGTRRTGYRRGRYEVKGTINSYWLNSLARSMVYGVATPSSAGSNSNVYLSQVAFTRYNIFIANANWPGSAISIPYLLLVNVVLEKDTVKWAADKPTTEDIAFVAEDIYGQ
jgi:hypothetical protein